MPEADPDISGGLDGVTFQRVLTNPDLRYYHNQQRIFSQRLVYFNLETFLYNILRILYGWKHRPQLTPCDDFSEPAIMV